MTISPVRFNPNIYNQAAGANSAKPNFFTSTQPVDASKTSPNKPAPAGMDAISREPAMQPITPIKAPNLVNKGMSVSPEKLAQMDNKLEGNRGDISNQSFGKYKGQDNFGSLLAYA